MALKIMMLKNKTTKKIVSLLEILLVVGMIFSVFSFNIMLNAPSVSAAPVCCEKAKNPDGSFGYCQYVDEQECKGLNAPTTCDQTSFCKTGCCFDKQGDGFCYANYPKALCTTGYNGVFSNDASCSSVPECAMGCCAIGNQAIYTTEIKCKKETALYPDLKMDFKTGIKSEAECLDTVRADEQGCCIGTEGSCSWTTRGSCKLADAVSSAGANASQTGFHKDAYCSSIGSCNCAPANPAIRGGSGDARATMCLNTDDSVYWKDSCGNPEGLKEKCDYGNGFLCGDPDKSGKAQCVSTNCQAGKKNDVLSVNLKDYYGTQAVDADGVLNGESWCMFDTAVGGNTAKSDLKIDDIRYHARDTVGSRYYRSICINGQELVEPCKDFRQEFCVSDKVDVPAESKTVSASTNDKIYTEAKCIANRGQSCIDQCNTADTTKQKTEAEFRKAQEEDFRCCTDLSKRDCAWTGKCVPKISLGFKYWESEGANTCGKANTECKILLRCGGWEKIAGWLGRDCRWTLIQGAQCFDQEFLQAENNICRSFGDCGANINYEGKLSKSGFTNTPTLGDKVDPYIIGQLEEFAKGKDGVKITLGSGVYNGDDGTNFAALEEQRASSQSAAEAKGIVKPKDSGQNYTGGYRMVPGYMDKDPDWDLGTAYYNYQEPIDDKGRISRLFGFDGAAWGYDTAGQARAITFSSALGGVLATGIISGATTSLVAGGLGFTEGLTAFVPFYGKWNFFSLIWPNTNTYFAQATAEKAISSGANKELAGLMQSEVQTQMQTEATKKLIQDEVQTQLQSVVSQNPLAGGIEGLSAKVQEDALKEATKKIQEDVTKKATENIASQNSVGPLGTITGALNVIMWAYMVYSLVDMILEETKEETIKIECKPWVQPTVRDDCEKCNPNYDAGKADGYVTKDGKPLSTKALKVCSEYKCRSLGATCKLLNSGTGNETCVSMNPYDVTSPVIKPWADGFTDEYKTSIKETGGGMKIEKDIPIYNNVRIAIKTDEPSQCKMSWNHSIRYNDMEPIYFGGQNYEYFHMQTIWVPAAGNSTEEALILKKGGGNYKIYVRCQDGVGNANEKDYSIQFKIGAEKDLTAPKIIDSSISKDSFLSYNKNETDVTLYVNEPAWCKWSLLEQDYDKMPAKNLCASGSVNSFGNYDCSFRGKGEANTGPAVSGVKAIAGESKSVYFRCIDVNKNFDKESYIIKLKGSNTLNITSIEPSGEIITKTGSENLTFEVKTAGGAYQDGTAFCKFAYNDATAAKNINRMTEPFTVTNSSTHTYALNQRTEGSYTFYVGCIDDASNTAYANTTIKITRHLTPPNIARIYKDDSISPAVLQLVVDEPSACKYSDQAGKAPNTIMIQDDLEGKRFSISADKLTYYIQCQDAYDNQMPVVTVMLIDKGSDIPSEGEYSSSTSEE